MIEAKLEVCHDRFELVFSKRISMPFLPVVGMLLYISDSSNCLSVLSLHWYQTKRTLLVDTTWAWLDESLDNDSGKLREYMEKDGWEVG
jgi:hypothetical protein